MYRAIWGLSGNGGLVGLGWSCSGLVKNYAFRGTKMVKRVVGVNERGLRVGQDHQRAKLTDAAVELIRRLHEDGMSYRVIAEKFEIAKSTVQDICTYRRRAQQPVKWRATG